jgi:CRP-like cAMP-binding protein
MRLDDVIALLKRLPLFDGVEPEALRILAFSASKRQFRAGDVLFRKGESADTGYLIIEGQIVYDLHDDGAPSTTSFGVGALLGQNALFSTIERPATAIARDGAAVLSFSRDLVRKVLEAHPVSAQTLRDTVHKQTREIARNIDRVSVF